MQAVMEISMGDDNWEPLEDPETGSAIVTMPGDDEDQFEAKLRKAFGRTVEDMVMHVGNSFRVRELTAEELENAEGAR